MSINRRTFMTSIAATAALPAMAVAAASSASPREVAKSLSTRSGDIPPNVILMIADDLGYGDLGCYGSKIPTPNLDRLAASGTRFTRYNAAHPICSASRAALLTGRYAPRSHTKGAYFPNSKTGMGLEEKTLADLFRKRGYQTHAIGKWHLGDAPEYLPTNRGFDSFFGVPYSDDMAPLPLLNGLTVLEADTDRAELTPRYLEEAVRILQTNPTSPFFLYLAYSYPHDPARGSKAFSGRSSFGDYGDAVEEIDWSVGRLMEALEKSGKSENTIVIFTADHGPWFQGSHGLTRGRKGSTFEGGVRIPFIMRWPGHVPSSAVCDEPLGHLNILPTLASWCDLQPPALPLDGFDMTHMIVGRQPAPAKSVIYFSPAGGHEDVHCIRTGAWKLRVAQSDGEIYINDHTQGNTNYWLAHPELYHIERDPFESYDVAKRNPEIVKQLLAELDREMLTFPEDVQASFARLKQQKASVVTPPGAAPRILHPGHPMPSWAYEPEDRRPV
jgi:arylsulfatase A